LVISSGLEREADRARVVIQDTGCGIPTESLDKIFDPFYTTKSEGKGTGLGLSIVYGIVKGHNGRIHVESEPGKGATITITFPVV
jgi:signal transduction histidine kinase